jgi:nitroimidazol reductase NimA-like FMN-containing flavoprotein (pyridoxamine 5'-phosphate oxidase superfamily)
LELLTEEQCRKLLASEDLGRVGVSLGALPAIFPVNYRMVGEDIVFRAGDGVRRRAAIEGAVVGFEVDRIDPGRSSGWSVMVVGVAREVTEAEHEELVAMRISPWAAGERTHFIRVHPEMISGRRIVANS